MMKNQQNIHQAQVGENKSVVASMGSMGSISPFIGVQDGTGTGIDGVPEGYHTMKYPVDRQNAINDP